MKRTSKQDQNRKLVVVLCLLLGMAYSIAHRRQSNYNEHAGVIEHHCNLENRIKALEERS